jgi:hypothetical protein
MMSAQSRLSKRFDELILQANGVEATKAFRHGYIDGEYVDDEALLNWRVKARNLLASACGSDSEHYRSFVEAEQGSAYRTTCEDLARMKGVFSAAKEDLEGGHIKSLRSLVQVDAFTSELEQAKELLLDNCGTAAAVIAGVVLETTLRIICIKNNIRVSKLDKMNLALSQAGEYDSTVQKQITTWAGIRNNAVRGHAGVFSKEDVESMIQGVERFVLVYI